MSFSGSFGNRGVGRFPQVKVAAAAQAVAALAAAAALLKQSGQQHRHEALMQVQ